MNNVYADDVSAPDPQYGNLLPFHELPHGVSANACITAGCVVAASSGSLRITRLDLSRTFSPFLINFSIPPKFSNDFSTADFTFEYS